MEWEKIISAIALGAMIWFLLPKAQAMMQQNSTAKPGEWLSVIVPLALVIGFVIFLIMLVR